MTENVKEEHLELREKRIEILEEMVCPDGLLTKDNDMMTESGYELVYLIGSDKFFDP